MIYHITAYENTPGRLIHEEITVRDLELKKIILSSLRRRGFIATVRTEK